MSVLPLYKKMRKKFVKEHGDVIRVSIRLTPEFLETCEERIKAGVKQYGDDWKTKNNIKERDAEVYDFFNYTILDMCQQEIKNPTPK